MSASTFRAQSGRSKNDVFPEKVTLASYVTESIVHFFRAHTNMNMQNAQSDDSCDVVPYLQNQSDRAKDFAEREFAPSLSVGDLE
jgi:hypothetical protein